MTGDDEKPAWWRDNERIRGELGLPSYRPPRFEDGTPTHEVTTRLEETHDCRIKFLGIDTRYPEDWEVRIDGESAFEIGHYRDEQGNTVYEMTAGMFQETVEAVMADDPSPDFECFNTPNER